MDEGKIKSFAKDHGYDSIRKSIKWGGYSVYEPFSYSENDIFGYSLFILVKNGIIRLTTRQEARELCGIIQHC